jgi:acyl carrier protein
LCGYSISISQLVIQTNETDYKVRFKDKQYQDEFTFFQMCLAIEQSFNIEFTDTEVLELDTVEELAKLVQTKRDRKYRNTRK